MYKVGDRVQIECEGTTVEGTIVLASSNGVSLIIQFETILRGHGGIIPVLMSDDMHGCSIVNNVPVVIRPSEG